VHTLATARVEFSVKGAGTFVFDPASCSAAVRERARLHGFTQRLSDKAAKGRDDKTGASATPEEKMRGMAGLAKEYDSRAEGWRPGRAGAAKGPGAGLGRMALAAVAEVTGRGVEEIRELVVRGAGKKGVGQEVYLMALCQSADVAKVLQRMREEAAKGLGEDG